MIIVSGRGKAGSDGKPKDVDREFVSLFMIFYENTSWLVDLEGVPSATGTGFVVANQKGTINGYIFANMPMMTMKKGERVRWYLATIGEGTNFHTPHWHGNIVVDSGKRTDVVLLGGPAQMLTVDMVPDDPGIWLYHCHVDDHMDMGMVALYKVEP